MARRDVGRRKRAREVGPCAHDQIPRPTALGWRGYPGGVGPLAHARGGGGPHGHDDSGNQAHANHDYRQYYRPHAGRSHVFTGLAGASRGHARVWVFHAASVPIRRHMLVRGTANPHDPAWNQYFRLRQRSTLLARPTPARFSASPHPVMEVVAEA